MLRKPRDFNAAQCMIWMFKFNPGKVDIYMQGDYPRHLILLANYDTLIFPDGWYYSDITKTINNYNSSITVRIVVKE